MNRLPQPRPGTQPCSNQEDAYLLQGTAEIELDGTTYKSGLLTIKLFDSIQDDVVQQVLDRMQDLYAGMDDEESENLDETLPSMQPETLQPTTI